VDYKNGFRKASNVHKWIGEGLWAPETNHMLSRVESLAKGAKVNKHPGVTFAFGLELLGPMEKLSRSFQAEGSDIPLEEVSWGTSENDSTDPGILCLCQIKEYSVGSHAVAIEEKSLIAVSSHFIHT
jgi:hypothetical protein